MLQLVFFGLLATGVSTSASAESYAVQEIQISEPVNALAEAILEPIGIGYFQFPPRMARVGGKAVGSAITAAEELMTEAGLTYVFVHIPVGRLYANFRGKSSVVQVWIGAVQPASVELGVLIEPSIFGIIHLNIYGLKGVPPPASDDLFDVSLITITGYNYGGFLAVLKARKAGVRAIATPNHVSAFRMLQAGRAPYVLDYKNPAEIALATLEFTGVTSTTVSVGAAGMLVSKQAQQKGLLIARLEAASRRIVARKYQ